MCTEGPGGGVVNMGNIYGNIFLAVTGGIVSGTGGTVDGVIVGSIGNDMFDPSHQVVTGLISGNGGSDTVAFASASAGFAIDLDQQTAAGAGESFDDRRP